MWVKRPKVIIAATAVPTVEVENQNRPTPSPSMSTKSRKVRASRPLLRAKRSGDHAAEGASEEGEQTEASRRHARRGEIEPEAVHVVARRDVVNEELDAEAGAVREEQHPDAVVLRGCLEDLPPALLAALDLDAARSEILVVALRAILRELVVRRPIRRAAARRGRAWRRASRRPFLRPG